MADGRKVTKRERREEAKQRRMEELRRRQRKARMRRMYTIGIAVLVIGGIVAAVLLSRQSASRNRAELAAVARAGGCEAIETKPSEGQTHSPPYSYRTDPPTSGNHSPSTAFTGVLTQAPKDENLVHNMEHGHVIVWYQPDLDPAILTGLTDLVNDNRTRLILVQRPTMPFKVAFTAWTKLQGCNSPNANTVRAAQAFADEFKGKGPEGDREGTPQGA